MKTTKQIRPEKQTFLFLLCWAAYFVSNLGRLNYGAVMAEILRAEGYANAAAGLVSTGFFVAYGIGQLLSGYIGDFLPPKWMVLFGLFCSGAANLTMSFLTSPGQMLAAWCVNGAVQATTWTPILRIIAENLPIESRHRACVNMATTYPVAALLTYVGCAGVIYISGWRLVFRITAVIMLLMSAAWLAGFRVVERNLVETQEAAGEAGPAAREGSGEKLRFPILLLALVCLALCTQGALRDGIMTWVPAYLTGTFAIGTSFSIFSTTLLPFVNLLGVYTAGFLHRCSGNEVFTALCLFGTALAGALALLLLGGGSLAASLVSFSVITSSMMGVNLMLVSFVPTYFMRWGKVSFVAWLVNSMVYVGSSVATYGIGAVADAAGWGALLAILVGIAAAGGVVCFFCMPLWRRFMGA